MKIYHYLLPAVIFILPLHLCAQETVDTVMMRRIREAEMKNSQVADIAHQLTDVCGPRLTNSPGFRKAVGWTVDELKSWGLKASPEAWGEFGKGWRTEKVHVALKQPYYEPMIA